MEFAKVGPSTGSGQALHPQLGEAIGVDSIRFERFFRRADAWSDSAQLWHSIRTKMGAAWSGFFVRPGERGAQLGGRFASGGLIRGAQVGTNAARGGARNESGARGG